MIAWLVWACDRHPADCQLFLSILTSLTAGAAASEKAGFGEDGLLGKKTDPENNHLSGPSESKISQ
jgi:hypothetical protein